MGFFDKGNGPKETVIVGDHKEALRFFEGVIEEQGCFYAGVEIAVDPTRATMATHTVGLADKGWPELVLVGVDPRIAGQVLAKLVGRGQPFKAGDVIDDIAQTPIRCEPISEDAIATYMGQAVAFRLAHGGMEIEALQLVFTDAQKRWPEDEGYDREATAAQVLLKDYRK